MYLESYKDLCHGTTEEFANNIRENGFELRGGQSSWCGKGVYFYDIKKKAWWSANRTSEDIKKQTGEKMKPAVVFADIIDIDDDDIFDLRVYKDVCDFETMINAIMSQFEFLVSGIEDDVERIIALRSILISFYATKRCKKLIIGNFKQRPQEKYEKIIRFSNSLDMVFGIETIYCVKDTGILSNIR